MMEAYIMSLDEEVDRGLEYVKLICGFDYANDVIKMLLSGFCISNKLPGAVGSGFYLSRTSLLLGVALKRQKQKQRKTTTKKTLYKWQNLGPKYF